MPEMLGNEVAARIHELRPGLPVLYMSGYAQPILDTHGATHVQVDIVEKPFTESGLLARVGQALGRGFPARAQGLFTWPNGPRPAAPTARLGHEAVNMDLKWAARLRDTAGISHDSRIIRRSCDRV
jgi:DNA-binding response OmpR family regulator